MSAIVKTAKVSGKGQITLPREIREALGTNLVRIVSDPGSVRIEPVIDVAGSLARYANKAVPFRVARERAWDAVIREKRR